MDSEKEAELAAALEEASKAEKEAAAKAEDKGGGNTGNTGDNKIGNGHGARAEIAAGLELSLSDDAEAKMENLIGFRRQWEETNTRVLCGEGGVGEGEGKKNSSRPQVLPHGAVEKGCLIVAHPLLIQGVLDRSIILLTEHDYPEKFVRRFEQRKREQAPTDRSYRTEKVERGTELTDTIVFTRAGGTAPRDCGGARVGRGEGGKGAGEG